MFELDALVIGAIAAFIVGISKTGVPGGALIAIPLFAGVFEGRLIAGGTMPVLLVADLFAVAWYRHDANWRVIREFVPALTVGYAAGAAFFVAIGSASGRLELVIGLIVAFIVVVQLRRMVAGQPTAEMSAAATVGPGAIAGFTTMIANAAGPVINSHLLRSGLDKHAMLGTSAWLYFGMNVVKIPIYAALGAWSAGGPFFTADSLAYDALLVPAVVVGVFTGRVVARRTPQRAFNVIVVGFAAAGALKLIIG